MKSQLMKALRALGIIPFFLMSVVACSDENESLPAPEDPEAETEVNVVDIDWDKTQLTGYDEVSGRMTLQFSGEMPRWNEGRSLMVVATDRITAVRRVMKVAGQDGQNVTLETRRASMADLFPGQSLRLSFEEAGQPQATRTADGALLPVEVEVMTANGYRTVYEAGQVTRAAASPDDYLDLTAHQAFFEVKVDTAEVYLDTLHAWSPVIEQFLFKAGLYGTFSFDFDLGEKEIAPGLVVPQGKLLTCNYLLSSRATLEMRIRQRVEQEYAVELQRTLLPRLTPTMRFRFMAGSVPVYIVVDSRLEAEGAFEASGSVQATYGLEGNFDYTFGLSWDGSFKFQRQTTPPFDVNFYKPTLEVEGSCGVRASLYPHLDIRFYDFVGIGLDLKPYVKNELKGKAMFEVAGEHYISLTDSLSVGFDVNTVASLEFLGVPLMSVPVPEGGAHLLDTVLFAAPNRLEACNPEPETVGGQKIRLDYDVYDFNMLVPGHYAPSSFGLVRFRTDRGTVSTPYAWPLNGRVSVDWTPAKGKDCFYAELLDGEGNVMSGDTIEHEDELGLIGYWKMYKYHYAEYAGATGGTPIYEEWDTEDPHQEFFDLKFEEGNIYYDIDPYDTGFSVGQYDYNGENLLILDIETEHPEPLVILQLDNEELVFTTTRDKTEDGRYDEETFYFKRVME